MRAIVVQVSASSRLLDDALAAAVGGPRVTARRDLAPGDPRPDITITTDDRRDSAQSRIVVVLPDDDSATAEVIVDGVRSITSAPRPADLHDFVIDLAHRLSPSS